MTQRSRPSTRPARLIAAATQARRFAHARYSHFRSAPRSRRPTATIVSGCNIENATYGLTLCAERVALVKALSEGHGVFTRIAVVADTEDLTPPCGPCRQLLWEYCGDIEIVLANLDGPDRPATACSCRLTARCRSTGRLLDSAESRMTTLCSRQLTGRATRS